MREKAYQMCCGVCFRGSCKAWLIFFFFFFCYLLVIRFAVLAVGGGEGEGGGSQVACEGGLYHFQMSLQLRTCAWKETVKGGLLHASRVCFSFLGLVAFFFFFSFFLCFLSRPPYSPSEFEYWRNDSGVKIPKFFFPARTARSHCCRVKNHA